MSENKTVACWVTGFFVAIGLVFLFADHYLPHGQVFHGVTEPVHCDSGASERTCVGAHKMYSCVMSYDEHVNYWCVEVQPR